MDRARGNAARSGRDDAGAADHHLPAGGDALPPVGGDASHAWASIYIPSINEDGQLSTGIWCDLDPTNNRWGHGTPGEDYVHLAQGRDYADVSPIRGVIHGGADHTLNVAVTVNPIKP